MEQTLALIWTVGAVAAFTYLVHDFGKSAADKTWLNKHGRHRAGQKLAVFMGLTLVASLFLWIPILIRALSRKTNNNE